MANDAKSIPSFLVRAHPKPAGIIHGRTFSLHFQLPKNLYVWICWVKLGPREILLYIYILFCHCLRQRWLRPGMGTRFSGGFQPVPVEKLRFFPGSTGKYAGGSGRLLRFRFSQFNRRIGTWVIENIIKYTNWYTTLIDTSTALLWPIYFG